MLPKSLLKGFDKGRLKWLLSFFFVALAIPTGALIWQAYSQLKWESFHQYRGIAEEFTNRVDARLIDMIITADSRSFADYGYLVVSGDPSTNYLQRSPLSSYPDTQDLPGAIGYFQVDADGAFSTPLTPSTRDTVGDTGFDTEELLQRNALAFQIQKILADNELVQSRSAADLRGAGFESVASPEPATEEDASLSGSRSRQAAGEAQSLMEATAPVPETESSAVGLLLDRLQADKDVADMPAPVAQEEKASESYSQQVFDELTLTRKNAPAAMPSEPGTMGDDDDGTLAELQHAGGKVADLKLDSELQKKSEGVEREEVVAFYADEQRADAPARSKRKEQIALPADLVSVDANEEALAGIAGNLRISTFESEIDPLEFSQLDSGHFVAFRKVWREGERYIQGILIDRDRFLQGIIDESARQSALFSVANLIVAYQDEVIHSISAVNSSRYPNGSEPLDGTLLYRNRLTAPLDGLEFIFSVGRLPPGPGAGVLAWVTLVLGMVFIGGFYTLYRLGLSQIELARQQQDFVSAVSHELKTPLTSIRMYGEMLKEGWADDEKRQSYYEFIHDESERLTRLISNVLQLAKITRNEPQFDMHRVNIGEIMSQIESKIAGQVERAGFALEFHRNEEADRAFVDLDSDCFSQIVINLVDNAIKFSKNADVKAIDIGCVVAKNNRIEFSIRDYGPGIPRDQMKKIFTLFYRTESELTRETVGTGIGLAIVHQLTTAMDGKIDIVNAKPGAEFRVSFPLRNAPGN